MGTDYKKLVFVAGIVRSGTSLLYSIINQHPSIALMYECDVWSFPKPLMSSRFQGKWLERLEFYNSTLSRHRLVEDGVVKGLEKVSNPEELYAAYGRKKGADFQGEKCPFYCTRLNELSEQYPGCSFIIIWRDPVEICQSVTKAGRRSRFFRRRGMLSRLIYYQESMIRQSRLLQEKGVRIHHITYDDLVRKTEEVCRGICAFLNLDFSPRMLDISDADFSPVFKNDHHSNLLCGAIKRQSPGALVLTKAITGKLRRYQARWKRLTLGVVDYPAPDKTIREPGAGELAWHSVAGKWLYFIDSVKRAFFEFIPISWLRTYRRAKRWYFGPEVNQSFIRETLWSQFKNHPVSIVFSHVLFSLVVSFDYWTGTALTVGPLYLFPLVVITLSAGRRWGTHVAAASAIAITLVNSTEPHLLDHWRVNLWNMLMRFCFFQIFVYLFDRVRKEYLRSPEAREGTDVPVP